LGNTNTSYLSSLFFLADLFFLLFLGVLAGCGPGLQVIPMPNHKTSALFWDQKSDYIKNYAAEPWAFKDW